MTASTNWTTGTAWTTDELLVALEGHPVWADNATPEIRKSRIWAVLDRHSSSCGDTFGPVGAAVADVISGAILGDSERCAVCGGAHPKQARFTLGVIWRCDSCLHDVGVEVERALNQLGSGSNNIPRAELVQVVLRARKARDELVQKTQTGPVSGAAPSMPAVGSGRHRNLTVRGTECEEVARLFARLAAPIYAANGWMWSLSSTARVPAETDIRDCVLALMYDLPVGGDVGSGRFRARLRVRQPYAGEWLVTFDKATVENAAENAKDLAPQPDISTQIYEYHQWLVDQAVLLAAKVGAEEARKVREALREQHRHEILLGLRRPVAEPHYVLSHDISLDPRRK